MDDYCGDLIPLCTLKYGRVYSGKRLAIANFTPSISMVLACPYPSTAFTEWKWLMPDNFEAWIAPLRGHDLCCFCKEGDPCHGDVLLKYANKGVENE